MSDADDIQKLCVEAVRANANKQFTTKCLACGKSFVRSLNWLQSKKFKCACGGNIDDGPLHQITQSVVRKLQGAKKISKPRLKRPESVHHARSMYQLVLQFRGNSLGDFDALIALEDKLAETLRDSADVDGHDVGSGEANIFILTSDPTNTFHRVKPVLEKNIQDKSMIAAYRDVNGEDYRVIWPRGSKEKFQIL